MLGLDKSDVYVILAIVGGFALLLLVFLYSAGFLGGWSSQLRSTHSRVLNRAESFLAAIHEDRYADALALMEPRYRDSVPLAQFKQVVTSDPFLSTYRSGQLGSMRTYDDTTVVLSGSLTAAMRTLRAEIHFVRSDGKWWLSEIVLGGRPTLRAVGQF